MTTREFMMRLSDQELAKKMAQTRSPREAYDVAKAQGLTDSIQVFVKEMATLHNAHGELSEAELESVAGGNGGGYPIFFHNGEIS